VRSFDHFKQVQVAMRIARSNARPCLPLPMAWARAIRKRCITLWPLLAFRVEKLRERRLTLLGQALAGRLFTLCLDETGDRNKGNPTDDVASQSIGTIGKLANGIVSVKADGVLDHIPFPLIFTVSKPKTRFKSEDASKTKPELAVEIMEE
jgi:hypothetical protein